nr:abhydrolase domain containing protein 8 [Hymenolepis microstoma]
MPGPVKTFGVLVALMLFANESYASKSLMHTIIRLNDTITNSSFYVCAYGFPEFSSTLSIPTTALIDARDLPVNAGLDEIELQMIYVKNNYPQVVAATKTFSLIVSNDGTDVYEVARNLSIPVILVETDYRKNVVKPNMSSADVFFVSKKTLQDLLNLVKMDSLTGLLMDFSGIPLVSKGYAILAFTILKLLSITSIVVAGLITVKNHEELLTLVHKNRSGSRANPLCKTVIPVVFILATIGMLLLAYFFYDIIVYFFIGLFVYAGASAMSFVFTTLLLIKVPALKQFTFKLCARNISVLRCVLFFIFLSFTITWCVFRNDPSIGWIMQDIIGVFLIIHILCELSILLSFKTISLIFLLLICYDVFFVFISPFFVKSNSSTASMFGPVGHQSSIEVGSSILPSTTQQEVLSRARRGVSDPGTSIMEAVASGSAGSSGELMPLVFKITWRAFRDSSFACQTNRDSMMLGFGDVVIPGLLCVFLAFYDACRKMKVPWNFICSLFGYLLGGLVVCIVLFNTKMAQPALLYLCPITFLTTVLCAYFRGGVTELRNLLSGDLPAPTLDNITAASEVIYYSPEGEKTLDSPCTGDVEQLVEIREGRWMHIEIIKPSVAGKYYYQITYPAQDKGTLVFIHGVGGRTKIWKNQVEYFVSEGYRTVTLDLVGHGLSPLTAQNCCCNQNFPIYSHSSSLFICLLCPSHKSLKASCLFHDSVLDVQAVVERYVLKYYREKGTLNSAFVLLVAHSYGSAIAICVALNYLNLVNGLVLISGGAPTALSRDPGLFSLPPWILTFLMPCLRKGFETKAYADRSKPIDPAVFDNMKILTAEERTSGYKFNAYTLWAVMAGQIWPQGGPSFYRQVKIPTLLLSGTEDRLVALDEEMETHFAIKTSYLHQLPGSGHMCMIEDPDRVNRFIGDHIQMIRNSPHTSGVVTTQPNR